MGSNEAPSLGKEPQPLLIREQEGRAEQSPAGRVWLVGGKLVKPPRALSALGGSLRLGRGWCYAPYGAGKRTRSLQDSRGGRWNHH